MIQRFKTEMLKMGFKTSDIAPCLFLQQDNKEFVIVAIHVDEANLFVTNEIIQETIKLLKKVFEMRDLGQTTFCLGLQFDYLLDKSMLHQTTYTKRLLKQFYMDKAKFVTLPMDLRSLDQRKDIFCERDEGEPLLGPEKPYLSAIGALMFLANQARPDIAFSVNLLARHGSQPTIRHWSGLKQIFQYLLGSVDKGLHFSKSNNGLLTGYADVGYLSNPTDAKSQTRYFFLIGPTAIS